VSAPLTTLGITWLDIRSYLEGQGVTAGLGQRGEGSQGVLALQNTPGMLYLIARSIRPAWVTEERALQSVSFQIRSVSDQNNYDSGEQLAFQIDRILMMVKAATIMGSVRVSSVQDLGGGPTLLPVQDNANRAHFTASYAFTVPSGLA
jgi:hypothetical protein